MERKNTDAFKIYIVVAYAIKKNISKFMENPTWIYLLLFIGTTYLVASAGMHFNLYSDNDQLQGIIVEAHGMVLDILILGFVFSWLYQRGERQRQIRAYKNAIDDFRGWESEEGMRRTRGNILRLNRLGIGGINLTNCYLRNANLRGVNLRDADLSGANLSDANLKFADLQGANLQDANLERADLEGVDCYRPNPKGGLYHTNLRGANLRGANLQGAKLRYAFFMDADLKKANISGARLVRTKFINANLEGADMTLAYLFETSFMGANLSGANFANANLRDVRNLLAENLCEAYTLEGTEMDDVLRNEVERICPKKFEVLD